MAKKQFDREQVLDNAMQLFWERGFHASSMQEVTAHTGLKPGSLYLEFGNKAGLFEETLKKYTSESIAELNQTLSDAPTVGHGICRFLGHIAQLSTESDYKGCFLIKTQLELAPEQGSLYNLATDTLRKTEEVFQSYLERDTDPEVAATRASSIMLHIFGVRVYGYRQNSVSQIMQGLQQGLPWLPWGEEAVDSFDSNKAIHSANN